MSPLILRCEAQATLEPDHLDRVTRALVLAIGRSGDEFAYQAARGELRTVPAEARWLVELCVEVEFAANGSPLRSPSGLRW